MKFVAFILLLPLCTTAQLKLAKIFSDNMVLQRDIPIHIWGNSKPGATINISLEKQKKTVLASADGAWEVYFAKQKANKEPQPINITDGKENLLLKNILIGDIWLCIGQSNMEFPLQQEMHYNEEITQTDQPLIRLYNPSFIGKNIFGKPYSGSMLQKLNRKDFYSGQWQTCDSSTAKTMSAIGYYFGKRIVAAEGIPVGLVHLAIGGCPLETFISKQALAGDKQLAVKLQGNWLQNEALSVWVKQRGNDNVGSQKIIYADDMGPDHAYKPGFAFAAGIEPMLGLPIKGVLWYQGESNAQEMERVTEYGHLLKLMITDYRLKWKEPALPFYWVQLSSIDTAGYKSALWPQFRDEQRKLLQQVSYSGMAVCSDIGLKNNVHPTNKKEVAERLARWALKMSYHKNIIPSGPLPLTAMYTKGNIIISFQYAGGLQTADRKLVRGFSVDGNTEAVAGIKNNKVLIPVKQKPVYVYYGWKPFTDANLVNAANLPASTFKIKIK